jgi:hypothetical protein
MRYSFGFAVLVVLAVTALVTTAGRYRMGGYGGGPERYRACSKSIDRTWASFRSPDL